MRPRLGRIWAAAAVVAAVGAAGGAPATRGAPKADELRRENAALAERASAAVLELYAFETALDRARAELATLRRRASLLERERESVAARLRAARDTVAVSERFLAARLRALYEEGRTDPLEVVLGATSLEEALDGLDGLHYAARQDREIIERTEAARSRLVQLAKEVEARSAELDRLALDTSGRVADLEAAQAARRAYLDRLASRRGLNAARIGALEEQARKARSRSDRLVVPAAAARVVPVSAPPATALERDEAAAEPEEADAAGGRLEVVATGYSLRGRTATGLPVGWGVVAADPSVIPLGTRLTIPGYGEGVAADIGSAVRGAKVDLWFPSRSAALRWGVRTVTITVHD